MTSATILQSAATLRANLKPVIGHYLKMLRVGSTYTIDAAEYLVGDYFAPEMKAFKVAMDADTEFPRENWPRFALEFGVRLGIEAAAAALLDTPSTALEQINAAVSKVRAQMRERIDDSPRTVAEARREKAAARALAKAQRAKKAARQGTPRKLRRS